MNLTFSDDIIPIGFSFTFFVEVKHVGKVQGREKTVNFGTAKFLIEFKPKA